MQKASPEMNKAGEEKIFTQNHRARVIWDRFKVGKLLLRRRCPALVVSQLSRRTVQLRKATLLSVLIIHKQI